MRRALVIAALAGVLAASPAGAQYYGETHWTGHIAGGATVPLNDLTNVVNTGWNFTLGATYWPSMEGFLGIMLEGQYNGFSMTNDFTNILHVPDAYGAFWPVTLNLVLSPRRNAKAGLYLVGGGGLYILHAAATAPTTTGGIVCEPWWPYYCYPTTIPADYVLGSKTVTKGGVDGGVGINLPVGPESAFYIEGRYHYVFTDKGNTIEFIPIVAGLRW